MDLERSGNARWYTVLLKLLIHFGRRSCLLHLLINHLKNSSYSNVLLWAKLVYLECSFLSFLIHHYFCLSEYASIVNVFKTTIASRVLTFVKDMPTKKQTQREFSDLSSSRLFSLSRCVSEFHASSLQWSALNVESNQKLHRETQFIPLGSSYRF